MTRALMSLTISAILSLFFAHGLACEIGPCEPRPFESGTFEVRQILEIRRGPDFEWLVGAEVVIDRDSETMTIRYDHDGSTYEVQYDLEPFR